MNQIQLHLMISLLLHRPSSNYPNRMIAGRYQCELVPSSEGESNENAFIRVTSVGDNSDLDRSEAEQLGYLMVKDVLEFMEVLKCYVEGNK